jgi:cytochrome c5
MMRGTRSFITVVLVALAMGVIACGGAPLPTATAADAKRAEKRWPGTTTEDLQRGRSLYRSRCANCHQPVAPRSIASAKWPGHVAKMRSRAGLRESEAELVLRYLITMSDRQ